MSEDRIYAHTNDGEPGRVEPFRFNDEVARVFPDMLRRSIPGYEASLEAIGSLAVDPVNTNVIWAGTGETFIRSNILTGNGIYKSVDGGATWSNISTDLPEHGSTYTVGVDHVDSAGARARLDDFVVGPSNELAFSAARRLAEDPDAGFLPSPGRIVGLRTPAGPGVRDDSGVYEGWEVPVHYDPLISKLIAWAGTRPEAIQRMRRALSEYKVVGIETTLPFFERVLRHPAFVAGDIDTSFIETALAVIANW